MTELLKDLDNLNDLYVSEGLSDQIDKIEHDEIGTPVYEQNDRYHFTIFGDKLQEKKLFLKENLKPYIDFVKK